MATSPYRILIVDDDPLLLFELDKTAADVGFEVIEAANGPDALEILNNNDQILALITDIDLGGHFDGLQLAAAARYRWEAMRIVVMSGMTDVDLGRLPEGATFLRKPVTAEQLAELIES